MTDTAHCARRARRAGLGPSCSSDAPRTQRSPLLLLPSEVLALILKSLETCDLLNCARVCSGLRAVVCTHGVSALRLGPAQFQHRSAYSTRKQQQKLQRSSREQRTRHGALLHPAAPPRTGECRPSRRPCLSTRRAALQHRMQGFVASSRAPVAMPMPVTPFPCCAHAPRLHLASGPG